MTQTPTVTKSTFFYVPLWVDDYKLAVEALNNDSRYLLMAKDTPPQYLMPYATNIYLDDSLYSAFLLKPEHMPRLCMYGAHLGLEQEPVLESVRISCFGTGCAFAEFRVNYQGLTIEQIADFVYRFKNATKTDTKHGSFVTMYDALTDLLSGIPEVEMFFTDAGFKRECRMFHQIFCEDALDEATTHRHLRHLSRGYHSQFSMPQSDSFYDMDYRPYDYDHWAGSQEGLVNLCFHSGEARTDYFIDHFKRGQLERNYSFMYLLLLNQRFTAIKLICRITEYGRYTRAKKEELNQRIVQLKTTFAFNIISDDQLYQNVYKRMYNLLDVDRLLEDIRDNEQHVELIQNYEALETEKMTSRFLFGLSLLSVFSVLIDAASYFDRIPFVREISTVLSLVCMIVIVLSYIIAPDSIKCFLYFSHFAYTVGALVEANEFVTMVK